MKDTKQNAISATPPVSKIATLHSTDGSTHLVGIGPIKVIICEEDGTWFAQGVDIDYAANGSSFIDVKKSFELGLAGTIDLHIKLYGNLKSFLKQAPPEVWEELYSLGSHHHYTHVGFHDDLSKTLGLTGYDSFNYVGRGEMVEAAQ